MAGVAAVLGLGLLSSVEAYSFLSCTDYDQAQDLCYGYPRKYIQWVGGASHAYDLQADIPANADQTTVSVDPLWQVRADSHTLLALCMALSTDGVVTSTQGHLL